MPWKDGLVLVVAQADTGPEDLELFPDSASVFREQLRASLDSLLVDH